MSKLVTIRETDGILRLTLDRPNSLNALDGEVHFINVGQSVSTLIVPPEGETMLIKTGDRESRGSD